MANIMILVPTRDMLEQAERVAREEGIELFGLKRIETADAVNEARQAAAAGANIIIARGLQALLIKQQTNIPLVEIKLTGQELGLLVQRAKLRVNREHPVLAFVGFKNMFSSMSYFESLFGVEIRTYLAERMDELTGLTAEAAALGCDIIIGGEVACLEARRLGLPALFYDTTEESIRDALYVAERAAYAVDIERAHSAQTKTLLGASTSGILKVDTNRAITMNNRVMEDLLKKNPGALIGMRVEQALPALDMQLLDDVLTGVRQQVTMALLLGETQLMLVIAPIEVNDTVQGAILTLQNLPASTRHQSQSVRDMVLSGHVARGGFEQIIRTSEPMRQAIEFSRRVALSQSPVLIRAETGTEAELFAQGIHMSSARRSQPYVAIALYNCEPGLQERILLGLDSESEKGALLSANFGTLLIQDIECLTPRCQYALVRAITQRTLCRDDIHRASNLDVRIIATTDVELALAVADGTFRADLYHLLASIQIEIPPLRRDREQIAPLANHYLEQYARRYAKYVSLADDAKAALASLDWPGNLLQLERFMERLALGSDRRSISGGDVHELYSRIYPEVEQRGAAAKRVVVRSSPEADKLRHTLDEHGGSRLETAKSLGISTTTLWRRMRKYGIDENYYQEE